MRQRASSAGEIVTAGSRLLADQAEQVRCDLSSLVAFGKAILVAEIHAEAVLRRHALKRLHARPPVAQVGIGNGTVALVAGGVALAQVQDTNRCDRTPFLRHGEVSRFGPFRME